MCYIQILQDVEVHVKLVRVLFLGMQGNFSTPCLRALLDNQVEVCAVVIPAPAGSLPGSSAIVRKQQPARLRPPLPLLTSSQRATIVDLAWQRRLPLWEVSSLSERETVSTLAAYRPDAICVACFSLLIPRVILDIPPLGCLNVHPSLLPALRGPEPLFWVYRLGLSQSGVSVHAMDEGMDTGDILAQERVEVPGGSSYAQLEERCARLGGELLVQAVRTLSTGSSVRRPQSEEQSSYQSFPGARDLLVPAADWSAARIYNFVCGVASWAGGVLLEVEPGRQRLRALQAISYSPENTQCHAGEIIERADTTLSIQCKSGWVKVAAP